MIPYEIWVTAADGEEYPLATFTDPDALTDEDAKTAAVARLQDVIDKINTPGSDTLVVKRGLITPPAYHVRVFRREEGLE